MCIIIAYTQEIGGVISRRMGYGSEVTETTLV